MSRWRQDPRVVMVYLAVVLLLCVGAVPGQEPPLITEDYEIKAGSWDQHLEDAEEFADYAQGALKKHKAFKGKSGARANFNLAQVFSEFIGHHDLTFFFLREARRYLESELTPKRRQLRAEIDALEAALAERRFAQLSRLANPEARDFGARLVAPFPETTWRPTNGTETSSEKTVVSTSTLPTTRVA